MTNSEEDHSQIIKALGGKRGLIDSGLPSLVFVLLFTITHRLNVALISALLLSGVLAITRLVKRDTVQHALSGFIGVVICAWFSRTTGKAEDFFLPGMIKSAIYGVVYLLANVLKWPVLGLILGPILGENLEWRKDPARLQAYLKAGWIWVGLFAVRLVVQVPLYLSHNVTALGVATVILSWPLFAATLYLTWVAIRGVPKAVRKSAPESTTPSEEID